MRCWIVLLLLLASVAAVAAEAERTVKTNEKVLDFVTGRIEDFYVDPSGPPGWPGEWETRFAAMAKLTETCAFYGALDDLLKQTGVSHFSATPPRDEREKEVRSAFRRMKLARIGGKYFVRIASEALTAAGVRPGDELLEVSGRPAAEYFTDLGCGATSASTHLRFSAPDGKAVEVDLPLHGDPPPAQDWIVTKELEGSIHYLKLRSFGSDYEPRDVANAIEKARTARGLILDLRGNPGGQDRNIRDLLGHFYDRSFTLGTFVNQRFGKYSAARAKYLVNYLRARSLTPVTMIGRLAIEVIPAAPFYRGPVFVLVDPYTASAAEMTALTAQKTRRATIVGERTAGAVLAVLAFNLPDGGKLSMPAAIFLDGDGHAAEGAGVVPDVEAPPTREDLLAGRDGALESALDLARRPTAGEPPPLPSK